MIDIKIVKGDNEQNFINELKTLLNMGYKINNSNMSMMDTQVAHRPAFYALLIKEV